MVAGFKLLAYLQGKIRTDHVYKEQTLQQITKREKKGLKSALRTPSLQFRYSNKTPTNLVIEIDLHKLKSFLFMFYTGSSDSFSQKHHYLV